jgi:ribonucleotide monophosphatase NagD (HAD superfamily)
MGDNFRTDIKGANYLNIDSIFISNGVHRSEFQNENELTKLVIKYNVEVNYIQPELTW